MNLTQSIFETLTGNAAIVAMFGSSIFAGLVPENTSPVTGPWLVFHRISNQQATAHDGDQAFSESRYQFTVGAKTKSAADAGRDLLNSELNGTEFTATGAQKLTFIHGDDVEHYDTVLRIFTASVDFHLLANT